MATRTQIKKRKKRQLQAKEVLAILANLGGIISAAVTLYQCVAGG